MGSSGEKMSWWDVTEQSCGRCIVDYFCGGGAFPLWSCPCGFLVNLPNM